MSECTFLESCGDRLPVNRAPFVLPFTQIVRLRPVGRGTDNAIRPIPSDVYGGIVSMISKRPSRNGPSSKDAPKSRAKTQAAPNVSSRGVRGELDRRAEFQRMAAVAVSRRPGLAPATQPPIPWMTDAPLALLVRYQQIWTPGGYARGDLLNSFALAPGEDLTLEVFNWDRARLEAERSAEANAESVRAGTVTGRISLETVTSLRFKLAAGAEAGVDGSVNLKEADIPAEIGGNLSARIDGELDASIQVTRQQMVEATRSATDTLRSSRKSRVVESVERGVESRSTRRIRNANRCHTLNFDIFEILECYEVATRLHDIVFAALIPLDRPRIDLDWLLCNEAVLRRALLDPVYAAGFDAAKRIKAADIYRRRLAPPAPAPGAPPATPGGGTTPAPVNAKRQRLKPFVDAIVDAGETIRDGGFGKLEDAIARSADLDFGDTPSTTEWESAIKEAARELTRLYLVGVAPDMLDQIDRLESACADASSDCEAPLRVFVLYAQTKLFALALPNSFQFYGIPVPYDDGGLYSAMWSAEAALAREDNAAALPPGLTEGVPEVGSPPAASVVTAAPSPEAMVDQAFGLRELAFDQVEVERLMCHVLDHLDHYLGAILVAGGPRAWIALLARYKHVLDKVEPSLIAISNGFAVFPLTGPHQRVLGQRNADLLRDIRERHGVDANPEHVTVPTHGMTMETRLGECDACEPFIQRHRELDLELRTAEVAKAAAAAEQAAAETARRTARLSADPPLLDDPSPPPPGPIEIRLVREAASSTAVPDVAGPATVDPEPGP